MNEKTREQIEAMKNTTFGVEIEGNGITRRKAAETAAKFFGTTAYYAAAEYLRTLRQVLHGLQQFAESHMGLPKFKTQQREGRLPCRESL